MGEITEVFEDLKDGIGDKGFYLLLAGAGALFIYNLFKNDTSETVIVGASGYSAYPDVEKNADVVISTLQNSIDYSETMVKENSNENRQIITDKLDDMTVGFNDYLGELGGRIEDSSNDLRDYLDSNFSATNDYIMEGLESAEKLNNSISGLGSEMDNLTSDVNKGFDLIYNQNIVSNRYLDQALKQGIGVGLGEVKSSGTSYYTYTTKKGLNTDTSIVDALKAIGGDSLASMESRTAIAKKNGITNYTGSYSQNVSLLNKLKSGKLQK